ELRRAPRPVADDLEPLAALAAGDGAEAVAVDPLEDCRPPPVRRRDGARLEAALAPREDELVALRPPAAEHAREVRRDGLTRPPRLRLGLRVEHGRGELGAHGDGVEVRRRVGEHRGADAGLLLDEQGRDAADRAAVVADVDALAE